MDAQLVQEFGVEESFPSEEDFLLALEARINVLLHENAGHLWQILYRLDISENAANDALAEGANAPRVLACLILDRQLEKAVARKMHTSPPPATDDDLCL